MNPFFGTSSKEIAAGRGEDYDKEMRTAIGVSLLRIEGTNKMYSIIEGQFYIESLVHSNLSAAQNRYLLPVSTRCVRAT